MAKKIVDADQANPEEFTMPVKEAAAMANVSESTLLRKAKDGEIESMPKGGGSKPRLFFRQKDVEELGKGSSGKERRPSSVPEVIDIVAEVLRTANLNWAQSQSMPYDLDPAASKRIAEIAKENPRIFRKWSAEDWKTLYVSHGWTTDFSEDEVLEAAEKINWKRRIHWKVDAVLGTHLADSLAAIVETMYNQTHVVK